ncbi:10098_t:CDS:2, partial [Racocetra fulgida]
NNLIANEYNKLKAIYEYFQLIILDKYKNKYKIASQEAANKVYIKPKSDRKLSKKNSLIENLEVKKQVKNWIDSQGSTVTSEKFKTFVEKEFLDKLICKKTAI